MRDGVTLGDTVVDVGEGETALTEGVTGLNVIVGVNDGVGVLLGSTPRRI